jgi:hypothetical protein
MFPLLGVFFLDHLLELVRFLAQLREGLLYGIGFLSAFLSGTEIGFFCSVFLETTAIVSIVHGVRAPMLLAEVAVFLGTSFLWDSGTVVSTRLQRTLFIAVQRFLVARSDGLIGSFLAALLAARSFLDARSVGLTGYFLATYVLDCIKRQKERTHVHRSPTFLVKVELILPCVRAGCDLKDQPRRRGLECEQSSLGHTLHGPFHCGLAS